MIIPRTVSDSGCSSCNERKHVVEFKIGPSHDVALQLVRFCSDCRRVLMSLLTRISEVDLARATLAASVKKLETEYPEVPLIDQWHRAVAHARPGTRQPDAESCTICKAMCADPLEVSRHHRDWCPRHPDHADGARLAAIVAEAARQARSGPGPSITGRVCPEHGPYVGGEVCPVCSLRQMQEHHQTGPDSCACGNLWPCTRMTGPGSGHSPRVTRTPTRRARANAGIVEKHRKRPRKR